MPGAYTHISMANHASARKSLEKLANFPKEALIACGKFREYCELGAVSPDYPYLKVSSSEAAKWADKMHYERTGDMIKAATRRLAAMPSGDAKSKCIAWLLGYTSHVGMDVTLHPIVNICVGGPYETHKNEHRWCEMNQDVYIYFRIMGLQVNYAEHLDSGIALCSEPNGDLNRDVAALWTSALEEVHPEFYSANPPDPQAWHSWFKVAVGKIAESRWLESISRHVAPDAKLIYPRLEDVDLTFVENLLGPDGQHRDFSELFEVALGNVHRLWRAVSDGTLGINDDFEQVIGNWNLDTGEDDTTKKLVFWGA